jgi:hypothetical protein
MSGPKTSSYQVSENELRRRRAVQEALGETTHLVAGIEKAYQNIQAFNQNPPMRKMEFTVENFAVSQVRSSDNLKIIEEYNRKIRQKLADLSHKLSAEQEQQTFESKLQQELFEQAREQVSQVLGYTGETETSADVLERYRQAQLSKVLKNDNKVREDKVLEKLEKVPEDTCAQIRQEIQDIAFQILDPASTCNKDAYMSELGYRIQIACKQSKERKRNAEEAMALLQKIRGYDSDKLSKIKKELELVIQKPSAVDESLKQRVETEYLKAKLALDTEYVKESISDTLQELGYDVEDEFTTLFSTKEAIRIQKPGWNEYFVQLRLNPDGSQMNYNVVRVDNESADTKERQIRDQEMETSWCGDFSDLVDTLKAKGIQHTFIRKQEPGEFPVQMVKDKNSKKTDQKKKISKPKSRKLD